ncbi:hypothetical protein VCUG_02838 [Vavraia culicis subsp. floridensis]|uniref:Uncharacterized protein n=1 Tax=Vavraia culicis (isolate floridensis) TaxID=948595 RepID=A0A024RE54_VAVCU|nr:uncharacterized protein VCUG_02838 [Vavraia culicis subsp. floridensis]ETA55720.1 hypothetical protein VCUG_02838 [Vavraia culicis subsp. floridensis]
MQIIIILIRSVYVMDNSYPDQDSGHIAGTSPSNTLIYPGMEVVGHPTQLTMCSDESQEHAQHDSESAGTSSSRKRKRVSGQSNEGRSDRLEKLQNVIFKVINMREDFAQEYNQKTKNNQGDLELSRYFDNLKEMLIKSARCLRTNKGRIVNTGTDNCDILSLISEYITFRTNIFVQMKRFLVSIERLSSDKVAVTCEGVKKISQLLKLYARYNDELYSLLTTNSKISEAEYFSGQSVKCVGCSNNHRNNCFIMQDVIDSLFINSLEMLYGTRVADKCLLFSEFTSLCGYFVQFRNNVTKIMLRDKAITIYLVSRIENIVTSCIKLRNRGDDQYKNKQNMLRQIDYRSFVRTFLFSQLLCVLKVKLSVISKYVFFSELEYTCSTVCGASNPDTVCDTFLEGYEPLFFLLSGLFDKIGFTSRCSKATWDKNLSMEHLDGKYILEKILYKYSRHMKERLGQNVKWLYGYIGRYLSTSYSERRDEILKKIEELDYNNSELMTQQVCDLYKCVRRHLEELIRR